MPRYRPPGHQAGKHPAEQGRARWSRTSGSQRAVSEADEDALTGTGIAVGTPEYMSPEQGSGDDGVDQRSDIYALGCALYEMLAGQPPFTGRTAQSRPRAAPARHAPRRCEWCGPAVSPEIEQVVETALAKVPADRYAMAAEFSRALEAPSGSRPRMADQKRRASRWRRAVVIALSWSSLASAPGGSPSAAPTVRIPTRSWCSRWWIVSPGDRDRTRGR